jgi:heat shock protein HslJ
LKNTAVLIIVLLVLNVISLIACGPTETTLDNTRWALESYGEPGDLQAVLDNTEITANFKGTTKQVTGSAGCNTYFSSYEASGNELSFSDVANTEMYCDEPEGVMEQEREYLALLLDTTTFVVENDQLIISISDRQVLIYGAKE